MQLVFNIKTVNNCFCPR